MKITSLSLDSQLVILAQLPSHTLLSTVPLVCARWYQLRPHVCLQRRTVKLSIRPNPQLPAAFKAAPSQFGLYPKPLDAVYVDALAATFPTVTHLVYNHWPSSRLETSNEQLQLLQRWTPSLVSFELCTFNGLDDTNPQFSAFFNRLLAALALMPRLKRLTLTIVGQLPQSDLSILGRLVKVELNYINSNQFVVSQLLQHSSAKLQRLSLGFVTHFLSFAPLFTSPQICSKIHKLRLGHQLDWTQLGLIFDHCSNLKTLQISEGVIPHMCYFHKYMCLLTKLPHLTNLILSLRLISLPLALSCPPLPVLPSIRTMTLSFRPLNSHNRSFFLLTEGYFPQLQVLNLVCDQDRCSQCVAANVDSDHCLSVLLQPLDRLKALKAVNVVLQTYEIDEHPSVDWLPRIRTQSRL